MTERKPGNGELCGQHFLIKREHKDGWAALGTDQICPPRMSHGWTGLPSHGVCNLEMCPLTNYLLLGNSEKEAYKLKSMLLEEPRNILDEIDLPEKVEEIYEWAIEEACNPKVANHYRMSTGEKIKHP